MWLLAENHWLNMAHALVVDDDATSTPQAVAVVFPGDVKRTLTGDARMAVLEWLEQEIRLVPYELSEIVPPQPQQDIEFHIKAPDVATIRDTLEALTQAVYTQTQRARLAPTFATIQAAVDYAIRSEGA